MEGMAVVSSMDKILTTLGLSGTLIVMGVIAFFVIKEVKKANELTQKAVDGLRASTESQIKELRESTATRITDLKQSTEKQIKDLKASTESRFAELQKHSDEHDEAIEKRLVQAEKDIKYLEQNGVTKEMLYRETEGWRSEIQLVRAEISKLPFEILKLTEGRKNEK